MDHSLQLVVLFLGLLLNTDVSLQKPSDVSSTSKPSNVSATPVSTHHPAAQSPRTSPEVITSPPLREVVLVTVAWEKNNPCEGPVHLTLPRGRKEPKRRICFESPYKEHFEGLCPQTNCGGFKKWEASESGSFQYVDDHGTVTVRENCTALVIQCTGVTKTRKSKPSEGYSGELAAYKAITGLLLVLVLAVLLQRYGRPTYAAIRQRLSQKRQSRWVGPTQSQSVHYHREQQAGLHPNNNTSKRHSYPAALEKLTVSSSREPSSNRNSDYSYN
ncbi:uncharacterized protein LOC116218509 isoform X2 [Clupea harengus]|uniref:Uncharacterized protein LOC116218509 isoform X2 n=1 Tax=Clupea harengus TaxID=7950 RepID=A0A6P8EWU7_CLUHA|nr:uncharacterized protein LOC116218509 isoform X2 [Clupea harengus]